MDLRIDVRKEIGCYYPCISVLENGNGYLIYNNYYDSGEFANDILEFLLNSNDYFHYLKDYLMENRAIDISTDLGDLLNSIGEIHFMESFARSVFNSVITVNSLDGIEDDKSVVPIFFVKE